nr:MAG TPA: hypothetical protein [Caudoviricetes sp.]
MFAINATHQTRPDRTGGRLYNGPLDAVRQTRKILSRGCVTDYLKFYKFAFCPVFSTLF